MKKSLAFNQEVLRRSLAPNQGVLHISQRVIASIFAAHEKVQRPKIKFERYFEAFLKQRSQVAHFHEWRRAVVRLADSRTVSFDRTVFAFLLYIFQLICVFISQIDDESNSSSDGRIATSVLLFWLVPVILIINAVENLTSRRIVHDILIDFVEKTENHAFKFTEKRFEFLSVFSFLARAGSIEYFSALIWSETIYTYRFWKLRYIISIHQHHHRFFHTLLLATLAAALVLIDFVGDVLILWYQIFVELNCRHIWFVEVSVLWIIFAMITSITYIFRFATGKYHWRFILIKNACIVAPSLTIMILFEIAFFNFCWCWSDFFHQYFFFFSRERVPLLEIVYFQNDKSVYPIIVDVALLLQLIMVLMIAVLWRRGFRLLRWREKIRRTKWNHVMKSRSRDQKKSYEEECIKCNCGDDDVDHKNKNWRRKWKRQREQSSMINQKFSDHEQFLS